MTGDAITVFFSYSHKDEDLRDQLASHLAILRQTGTITNWYDRDITAGSEWNDEILTQLNRADVILLLISADFLNSSFCWDVELTKAIARHDKGEAKVIPVILRDVDWQGAPFGKLQALPKNAQPVTDWNTTDAAFTDVAKGIRKTVETLRQKKALAKQQALSQFETAYQQAAQQQYPLPLETQGQLDRLQTALGLSDQDVAPIKTRLNSEFGEARQRLENYRQEVRHCLEANDGEITPISRTILNGFRFSCGLTPDEAAAIEQEEIAPYETERQNLAQYESVLKATLQQENPLSDATRRQLSRLQRSLHLSDEQVQTIEAALQAEIAEQQRQQAERKRQEAKRQQQEVERERQEAERRQREAEADLRSERGVDYTRLQKLLQAQQWREADRETYRLMITTVGKKEGQWFNEEDLLTFPCEDLKIIDKLWVKHSNGKFGFSVQKKIYVEDCGATPDGNYPGDKIWCDFCDRVGWRKSGDSDSDNLTANPQNFPAGNFVGGELVSGGRFGLRNLALWAGSLLSHPDL